MTGLSWDGQPLASLAQGTEFSGSGMMLVSDIPSRHGQINEPATDVHIHPRIEHCSIWCDHGHSGAVHDTQEPWRSESAPLFLPRCILHLAVLDTGRRRLLCVVRGGSKASPDGNNALKTRNSSSLTALRREPGILLPRPCVLRRIQLN